MKTLNIDKRLEYPERSLRTYNGKMLFAPVGERLFCDVLNKKPGFCGNIDFIHKMNIDQLFTVECSTKPDYSLMKTVWYPSRLLMELEDEDICFKETKMITKQDVAFAAQTWTNKSAKPLTLTLVVKPAKCTVEELTDRNCIWMQMEKDRNQILVGAAIRWDAALEHQLSLQPGESVSFTVAAAAGDMPVEDKCRVIDRLDDFFAAGLTPEQYVERNAEEFNRFFENIPTFESSDEWLDKTWLYRWFILNHCTAKPKHGFLQHTTIYEGRGHKTAKFKPLEVSGWEFSRLISLSQPLHLTDYKWCHDKERLHDAIRGVLANEDEDGLIQSVFVHHRGGPFANFYVWAIYQLYLVEGDLEFVKEILPLLKKCVDGNTKVYGAKNDNLQIEVKHQRTGKEFQPSYWYFNNFPVNGRDKSLITPLKRMDTSVYHYLNNLGLSKLMEAAGDPGATQYKEFAATLAKQINEKTWDEETGFYYDLHFQTDEKAMVKNIVGCYPYWAELADDDKIRGINYLFEKEYFNTGDVFSTVAKDCVAYAPAGGWMGSMHGRDSCVWDGPSWPYTNGIMLDAIGKQSKLHEHKYDKQFGKFLRKYSMEHYRMHDIAKPYLVEQYHAETGEAISDEPDYNHSYYLELLVEHVAGLRVYEDKAVIDPLNIGLKYFKLDKIDVRGKVFTISYSERDREALGIKKGFCVTVDGREVHSSEKLMKVEIALNSI